MRLQTLIKYLAPLQTWGDLNTFVDFLIDDSRKTCEGSCYVATKGVVTDGHQFISDAIHAGARAIIAETKPTPEILEKGIVWIQLANTSQALPQLANTWYRTPSNKLKVVGVTGTNGKTTTTFLIHAIFKQIWHRAGLIGTIICKDGLHDITSTQTTPGILETNALLAEMVDNDCRGMAMEVSSHALTQNRVDGISFDVGIFTNLTQDHLDYHHNMESYFDAKRHLFEKLVHVKNTTKKKPFALINIDSDAGKKLATLYKGRLKVRTYGFNVTADYRVTPIQYTARHTVFELSYDGKSYRVQTPLIGRFNIYNAVAALAAAHTSGISLRTIIQILENIPQIPGRMEVVKSSKNITAYVDYAHTPDAVANACRTVRDFSKGKLITVIGCGGDRDHDKRPKMGKIATELSDYTIITSDNPRSESPEQIIKDIEEGIVLPTHESIVNRKEAIEKAVSIAKDGDVILVAGKGHEDYQEIQGVKYAFDDRKVLLYALESLSSENNN